VKARAALRGVKLCFLFSTARAGASHWESPVLSGDVKMEFIHVVNARANRGRIVDQSAPTESVMEVVKVIGNSRAASRAEHGLKWKNSHSDSAP
jgi:hypothetical protein